MGVESVAAPWGDSEIQAAIADVRTAAPDVSDQQLLIALMEHSRTSCVIYLDRAFRIVMVNHCCAERSGRSEEELIGRDFFAIYPDQESELVLRQVLETGARAELRARPQGVEQDFFADWTITAVKAGQDIVGLVVSLTDVTNHVREQRLSEALTRILTSFVLAQEPDEVFDSILERSTEALEADRSRVWVYEHGTWIPKHRTGPAQANGDDQGEQQRPVIAEAARTGTLQFVEDALDDGRIDRRPMERTGACAFIAMPLILKARVLGVLEISYSRGPRRFDALTRHFVGRLAVAASIALERADDFERQRSVSKTLQGAVLAIPPEVPGIRFAHAYRSASYSARVGGDLYDIFEIDDEHVGIVIADVAGKGVQAATLTSLVKHSIRAHAVSGTLSPAAVLSAVNEVVLRSSAPEEFVTVFFGVLDRGTGRLVYANAGHTTALIVRTDGSLGMLVANSPFIGAFADVPMTTSEATMQPGDLLVAYTDGLTEAKGECGLFGERGLLASVGSMRGCSPLSMVEHVIEDVLLFSRGTLHDDLALLAVTLERRRDGRPQQEVLDLGLDARVPQS